MDKNKANKIEELISQGKQAIDNENYQAAKEILVNALRLAPFRTDIKELFSLALEKSKGGVSQQPSQRKPGQAPSPAPSPSFKTTRTVTEMPQYDTSQRRAADAAAMPTQFARPEEQKEQTKPWGIRNEPNDNVGADDLSPDTNESYSERAKTVLTAQPHVSAKHARKSQMSLRNNNRSIMFVFTLGFLSFLILAGFLFFGEGIRGALIKVIKKEPPIDPKQQEVNAKVTEAKGYIAQGSFVKAIEILEAATAITAPDKSAILQNLGQAYFEEANRLTNTEKYKEAIDYFDKAVALFPNNKEYLKYYGHAYFERARKNKLSNYPVYKEHFEKAIEIYLKAMKIAEVEYGQPDFDLYQSLARAYVASNQPIEAMSIYQKIIDTAPPDSQYAISAASKIEIMTGRKVELRKTSITPAPPAPGAELTPAQK